MRALWDVTQAQDAAFTPERATEMLVGAIGYVSEAAPFMDAKSVAQHLYQIYKEEESHGPGFLEWYYGFRTFFSPVV